MAPSTTHDHSWRRKLRFARYGSLKLENGIHTFSSTGIGRREMSD